jgi:hypothetical protein
MNEDKALLDTTVKEDKKPLTSDINIDTFIESLHAYDRVANSKSHKLDITVEYHATQDQMALIADLCDLLNIDRKRVK